MRKIYRKIRITVLAICFSNIVLFTGCTEKETVSDRGTKDVYQLGNQEVQIDLSQDFACTEQTDNEIIMNADIGEIKLEYLEGEGVSSGYFPKSEGECVLLFDNIIGNLSYQIEEFRSYENEGLYYVTIRYDLENEVKYLIASGNFDTEYGYQVSAVLNTGNRETAQEIQNAVYNVKVFTE